MLTRAVGLRHSTGAFARNYGNDVTVAAPHFRPFSVNEIRTCYTIHLRLTLERLLNLDNYYSDTIWQRTAQCVDGLQANVDAAWRGLLLLPNGDDDDNDDCNGTFTTWSDRCDPKSHKME